MTKNKLYERFSKIHRGENEDNSDEYYTLFPAFAALFIELYCRHSTGITYKVIICPCDSKTSIFHELEKYADMIGNPKIIYSFFPQKDWLDYFDMDYQQEYGCKPDEVCIFTNPPFKGLSESMRKIKCDYLLFGSHCTSFRTGIYAKETGGFVYRKNNNDYDGNADNYAEKYGEVNTMFYSNRPFLSQGTEYINPVNKSRSILFGKDKLKKVKD